MRKQYIFIALAVVAVLAAESCKNRKSNQELTSEEINEQKVALSDSVLAKIDTLAANYFSAKDGFFTPFKSILTDANMLDRPDYLLDPSVANTLVTRDQKINAIGIYFIDYIVRNIYNMPLGEAKEAIARLAMDVNYSIPIDKYDDGAELSSIIREAYDQCRENGEINCFWQLEYAMLAEVDYVIASCPGLFFYKVADEQWVNTSKAWGELLSIIAELAKYDEEMASILEGYNATNVITSEEDIADFTTSKSSAKQFYIKNYKKIADRRNALIQ